MTRHYKCTAGLLKLPVLKTGQHPKEHPEADSVGTGKQYTVCTPPCSKNSLGCSKQRNPVTCC